MLDASKAHSSQGFHRQSYLLSPRHSWVLPQQWLPQAARFPIWRSSWWIQRWQRAAQNHIKIAYCHIDENYLGTSSLLALASMPLVMMSSAGLPDTLLSVPRRPSTGVPSSLGRPGRTGGDLVQRGIWQARQAVKVDG